MTYIGISADPGNFIFFSSLHEGRVTPAELNMTILGNVDETSSSFSVFMHKASLGTPTASMDDLAANVISNNFLSLSMIEPCASLKPVAHHIPALHPFTAFNGIVTRILV